MRKFKKLTRDQRIARANRRFGLADCKTYRRMYRQGLRQIELSISAIMRSYQKPFSITTP